jgi:hypothetical protein
MREASCGLIAHTELSLDPGQVVAVTKRALLGDQVSPDLDDVGRRAAHPEPDALGRPCGGCRVRSIPKPAFFTGQSMLTAC